MASIALLLFISWASLDIRVDASPIYDTDEDGNIVIDELLDESNGNVTVLDEPLYTDDEILEVVPDGTNVTDNLLIEESKEDEVLSSEILLEDETSSTVYDIEDDSSIMSYASPRAVVSGEFTPDSCIIYSASYSGGSGYLLIPTEFYDCLYVDDNGVLWNVGEVVVNGRFVSDLSISSSDYNVCLVSINSLLTSTPQNAYSYGSYTRTREYYESNSRLSYDDVYGEYTINGDLSSYSRDNDFTIKLILMMILAVILLGGFLVCYRQRSNTL